MRPLRLELQAFGSYPGREVVDFAALAHRGIFVVSGPTGAGKTTVFDAMVYALYGALPGRRSSYGDPRSHHASATVDTYVRLEFEVAGERYLVHRAPKQDRPKMRGHGVTERAAEAYLAKMVGTGTEPVCTQTNATTKAVEQLVGLDAKQFQRVVLLPQGEFADFLIASDEDRERLLRQLFGGELFEQATQWLKRRVAQLDLEVERVDNKVEHHRSNAVEALAMARAIWLDHPDDTDLAALGDEALQAAVDLLAPHRVRHRHERDRLQSFAAAATAQHAAAVQAALRFDDVARTAERLATLEAERAAVEVHQTAVDASRRARPVVAAQQSAEGACARHRAAQHAVEALRHSVESGFAALALPVPALQAADVVAAVAEAGHELAGQQQRLAAAEAAVRKADTTHAALTDAIGRHQLLQARLAEEQAAVDELEATAEQLVPSAEAAAALRVQHREAAQHLEARTQLVATEGLLQQARQTEARTQLAYEGVMARFVATQAPRLAEQLRPGEPCPVCGSASHPSPAAHDDLQAVDHDAVDAARARWASATATVGTHAGTAEALREQLGPRHEQPVEALHDAERQAAAALAVAEASVDQLSRIRRTVEQGRAQLGELVDREQRQGREVAVLEGRARSERDEAGRALEAADGVDATHLRRQLAAHATLADATRDITARFEAVTAAAAALQSARQLVADALAASEYVDVAEAEGALLPAEREAELHREAEAWHESVADATTRLAQLHEQGVPAERPDVDALSTAAREAAAAALATADAFTTASNALDAAHDELSLAMGVAAGSAGLRHERDTARVVFKTCNGEAGMRVKLERWVLAGELERVTRAANGHLEMMTNHRYTLHRSGTKGGLALEVFDAHTGRARATASLSGGEQFQASLSLALGLADVVSHGGSASGKQFEALFVDEGFGSLDPDALDDAVSALSQLHAAGRTVGAITHVEAMKQRLHVGIEVVPNPDGRGSSLRVHP